MANGIRTGDPREFNKGRSSKFREGSRGQQIPEEGWRTYGPKRYGNNNKDEDNSLKTLMISIIFYYSFLSMILFVHNFTTTATANDTTTTIFDKLD